MSIILCVTTYFLCVTLKNMKRTNFFPNSVWEFYVVLEYRIHLINLMDITG